MRTTLTTALLLFAIHVHAATISSISPTSFQAYGRESFLTVYGEGLGDLLIFNGPAGPFEVQIRARDQRSVTGDVPGEIINTPGRHTVAVRGSEGETAAVAFEVNEPWQPLMILVPDPIVAEAESRAGAHVTYEVWPWGGKDPDPVVLCDPPSGALFPLGRSRIRCEAGNRFGEHAQADLAVFVYDGASPVLTLPNDIVVDAESDQGTVVQYEVSAHDNVDGDLPVGCAPASGSRFPIGVTTVRCNAGDSSMNPAEGAFTVTVRGEEEEPMLVIQVPDDILAEAAGRAGANVTFEVTAHGSDDPEPAISCDPASGSLFPFGTTTVTCIATDRFGGRAEGRFDVTVVDGTVPALHLADIIAEATHSAGAEVTFTPTATDVVDGDVEVICTPPSGSLFRFGPTTVQCSAADSSGNTAQGSFVIQVTDTIAPIISNVRATPDVLEPPNHELVPVTVSVDASDAIDPMPRCAIADVTANEPIVGAGSGNTELDWQLTGDLEVQLRAERSGQGDGRIYTIHVSCTDSHDNEAQSSVDVTVPKGGGSGEQTTVVAKPTGRRRAVGKP
jgi:hypothetical protein